jgi:hypothetical protein
MDGLVRKDPVLLPNVSKEMLSPDFWISSNDHIVASGSFFEGGDPTYLGAVNQYLQEVKEKTRKKYFNSHNSPANLKPWNGVNGLADLNTVAQLYGPKFGLMVRGADLRFLPFDEPLLSDPGQPDIDRNQVSGLDPGNRCVVFARSLVGKWVGVITDQGVGWVPEDTVALGPESEIDKFQDAAPRLIITDPDGQVEIESETFFVSMGSDFPLTNPPNGALVPVCAPEGNLDFRPGRVRGETSTGYLQRNQSNLIRQAFKYLGYQYAWGDHDCFGYGRDCSRLVQDVLKTLGIDAPRNSQDMLAAGKNRILLDGLSEPERITAIRRCLPGSLVFTNSHVMIYLGEAGKRFYVIHALYEYPELAGNGESKKVVKQVTVSDLSLGEGTANGSLQQRLTGIVKIF